MFILLYIMNPICPPDIFPLSLRERNGSPPPLGLREEIQRWVMYA